MTDHKAGKVRRLLTAAAIAAGVAVAGGLAMAPAASAAGLSAPVVHTNGCSGCGGGGGGGGGW